MQPKKLFTLVISILVASYASGQTLPLINYTIQNGLPEATVYAVHIDNRGYLWSGTQGGVCSFNGRNFQIIDSQSEKVVSSGYSYLEITKRP